MCLRACPCASLPNPLNIFCGNVPDLWQLFYSFVKIAVPECLPLCLTAKIHYIYFLVMCLICRRVFDHLLKWLCLHACPYVPLPKSTISILWQCTWYVEALLFICWNSCVWVPAYVPHYIYFVAMCLISGNFFVNFFLNRCACIPAHVSHFQNQLICGGSLINFWK